MPKPTPEQIKERENQDVMMQRIENPLMVKIAREKNRYITEASKTYDLTGDIDQKQLFEHQINMTRLLETSTGVAIRRFANYQQNQFSKKQKQDAFDLLIQNMLNYWLINETANLAKETANTTQDDIKRAIQAGIDDGETNKQISKRMLRVKGLSPFRSETIARTEIHNASMYAMRETAKEFQTDSGIQLLKQWVPVSDPRTRERHRDMSGHAAIPVDDLFTVGIDKMDRPGDSQRGSAENVINCRCTLAYIEI